MSLPREARDGGPGTAASHRTSGPTAPPLDEHDSLETVPLLKKLLTSQSQRSASERPSSLWDSRTQENLHRPGSARPGGIRGPGPSQSPSAARALPHAPSRREEPPPARPPARSDHGVPSEAAALLSRPPCARRRADGVGRGGAGRPDGPDRPRVRAAQHAGKHFPGLRARDPAPAGV